MLREISRRQAGVVTLEQTRACGISDDTVRARIRAGRWQRPHPKIIAMFSGSLAREAILWAAVLRAGDGAVLSHETAAEIDGLIDRPDRRIHVTVPWSRHIRIPGAVVHRSSRVHEARHPARLPPRTRIEETVLDLTQTAGSLDDAMAWLATACQRRLTTPERVLEAIDGRHRLRWRRELREALGDIRSGTHTLMEIRYLRDVERAHRLPACQRQQRIIRDDRVNYDDVRNAEYGVVIELDGSVAHPAHARARDRRRDNSSAEQGDLPLRYGWSDITERPCETASQLARVFQGRGWTGHPLPCSRPGCAIAQGLAALSG